MTRTNLVDAYDNRSVVAKLVNMEERISGAETSVEASAEAAATSASKAAVSQTAAKTSEANAKASADTAAATLSNTVDLSSKQTITGAKTFAGDTTVTGQLISSGTNTLSGTTELEGTVELDSTAVATLNGKVTASNTGNSLKVANHDTALISNDVLSAKDINEVNGSANNLLHRSGDETMMGEKLFNGKGRYLHRFDVKLNSTGSKVDDERWQKIIEINSQSRIAISLLKAHMGNFQVVTADCNGTSSVIGCINASLSSSNRTRFCICQRKDNGYYEVWANPMPYASDVFSLWDISIYASEQNFDARFNVISNPTIASKPVVGDTYSIVNDDRLMTFSS